MFFFLVKQKTSKQTIYKLYVCDLWSSFFFLFQRIVMTSFFGEKKFFSIFKKSTMTYNLIMFLTTNNDRNVWPLFKIKFEQFISMAKENFFTRPFTFTSIEIECKIRLKLRNVNWKLICCCWNIFFSLSSPLYVSLSFFNHPLNSHTHTVPV